MSAPADARVIRALTVCLALSLSTAAWAVAQSASPATPARPALTAADYARAERFLSYNTAPLVLHGAVQPNWVALPAGASLQAGSASNDGDRFWYRTTTESGVEFVLVDPARKTKAPAFDHVKLAAALSKAAGKSYQASALPFSRFTYAADGQSITFIVDALSFTCDVGGTACSAGHAEKRPAGPGAAREVASPDGKLVAFIKENNLWVRDISSGQDRALTTDGVKDFGYATDNAGWRHSDAPVLLWSPDSKKIATFLQDQRGVGEMYLVETKVGRPTLRAWKYPLPGDEVVPMLHRVVIHLDGPRVVRLKMAPDFHRGTVTDDIRTRSVEWDDVEWSADSRQLAFVSTSRDHKVEQFRVANPETGGVREVFEEKTPTYFESGTESANWRFLAASNEFIWASERDNWSQLYLYDLRTGQLKNAITTGDGDVTRVLRVDEKNRVVYFEAVGREKGRQPYFRHLYRVGFDGTNLALLTPEDADHEVALAPTGAVFTDNFSRPDQPTTSVLRSADGREVMPLEKADVTKLQAIGWKPPVPITVKARDGVTDLYGLLFQPTKLDPSRKYPIIDNVYPGPQGGSVGSTFNFSPTRGETQALAELGFVVVQIEGMCNPRRSKAFHTSCYGNMEDNTLPDQVTAIQQLAKRYPWIDVERVGIYGGSGGGYATAAAMFRYPDFFKVGVSTSGNHDNRGYEDDWAEKWEGLLVKKPDGTSNYDGQANQEIAKNLKGKLLLAHGTTDDNVPPYNTLLVVDALIKANKDFDLVLFPNRGHGLSEPYMIRRRWDYFVRNLLGAEPPKEFEFKPRPVGR